MSGRGRLAVAGAAAVLAVGIGACGGDSDTPETTTTPEPRPVETFQKVPDLAPGWKVHANRTGGFALGVPPGWKARNAGSSTSVRSFDHLVAVSITPDRSDGALEIPLEDFAARALTALPGFEGGLEPGPPRSFRGHYPGIEVRAAGTAAETDVREQVRLVVLRRDDLVTFTAVIAVNAKPSAHASERLAERMLRTLRSRPAGASGSGERP